MAPCGGAAGQGGSADGKDEGRRHQGMSGILFQCPACRQWMDIPDGAVHLPIECLGCRHITAPPASRPQPIPDSPPLQPSPFEEDSEPRLAPLTVAVKGAPAEPAGASSGSLEDGIYRLRDPIPAPQSSAPTSDLPQINRPPLEPPDRLTQSRGPARRTTGAWRFIRVGLQAILIGWLVWGLGYAALLAWASKQDLLTFGWWNLFGHGAALEPLRMLFIPQMVGRLPTLAAYGLWIATLRRVLPTRISRGRRPASSASAWLQTAMRGFAVALLALTLTIESVAGALALGWWRMHPAAVLALHVTGYAELLLLVAFLQRLASALGDPRLVVYYIEVTRRLLGRPWDLEVFFESLPEWRVFHFAAGALSVLPGLLLLGCCLGGALWPILLLVGPGLCPALQLVLASTAIRRAVGAMQRRN